MKTQRHLFLLSIICLSFLLVKCGKDGAVGPQGNNGDKGATGAQGSGGPIGPAGPTGTANVIYSDWIKPAAYTKTTIFGTTNFSYNIAASKVTQAILDNGTVIVYGKLAGYVTEIWPTGQVSALPIIITYNNGTTQIDTWSSRSTVGKIQIVMNNNNNLYNEIATAHSFRYVIIPGGVHTTALAHTNLSNYAEVKQALHLVD